MMKRITYISRLSSSLSVADIETIGMVSSRNNTPIGVTGLLVYFQGLFFQIIEGDEERVDQLYAKIGQDPRHTDILCLKSENAVQERLFPTWSMQTINLDHTSDELLRPIKILLQTVVESHTIIERYTQPAVLKIVNQGINPLMVAPASVEKVILFGDIVAYSTLSKKMPQKDILLLLNTYFDICSRSVLHHGGETNKFLGDGVMAYFDAPDAAIRASLEILGELHKLRQSSDKSSPLRLLYTGFGLAQGIVIEGNMGSHIKTDYTIIGDAVNTASRLEGLTREVKRALVMAELVSHNSQDAWNFVSLGKHHLKGQEGWHEVYSLDHELADCFPDMAILRDTLHQLFA